MHLAWQKLHGHLFLQALLLNKQLAASLQAVGACSMQPPSGHWDGLRASLAPSVELTLEANKGLHPKQTDIEAELRPWDMLLVQKDRYFQVLCSSAKM